MRIYWDLTASDTDITQVGRMRIDRLGGAEVYIYPEAAHKSTGLGRTYVRK